jgi:hypothetical protein
MLRKKKGPLNRWTGGFVPVQLRFARFFRFPRGTVLHLNRTGPAGPVEPGTGPKSGPVSTQNRSAREPEKNARTGAEPE